MPRGGARLGAGPTGGVSQAWRGGDTSGDVAGGTNEEQGPASEGVAWVGLGDWSDEGPEPRGLTSPPTLSPRTS